MNTPNPPAAARRPPEPVAHRGPGLSALGGVVLAVGAGLVGAVVDVVTGPGLRTVFAVLFVLGCALAALLVRRSALPPVVVMPPLAYLLVTLVAAGLEATGTRNPWLNQQILEAATSLVVNAPVLLAATAAAATIAAIRGLVGRQRHASPALPRQAHPLSR